MTTEELIKALRYKHTDFIDRLVTYDFLMEVADRLEALEDANRDYREVLEVLHEANNIYAVSSKANADDLKAYIEKSLAKHTTPPQDKDLR